MAKTNTAEPEENTETGDAPLIDLNEASLKKLMARAKKRGYITYDELNDALPQDQMSSEQIEDVMSALSEMGVNIVENEEADEDEQPEADGARARVKQYAAGLTSIRKIAQHIDVIYADEIFTRENGMLRPNMKLDRKAIAARYG